MPPTRSGDELHVVLARVARAHRAAAARALTPLGLHPGQDLLLDLLWQADGRTQADLVAALGVEAPTVTKMAARLEAAGFVVRLPHPDDGRAPQVWLTEDGWALRSPVHRAWRRLDTQLTAALSDRQAGTLRSLLGTVAADLDGERRPR